MEKRYLKTSHRLDVKYINGSTNELLFEVKNRSWMDVGEFFTDEYVNQIIKQTLNTDLLPEDVVILVAANFKLR